MMVTINLYWLIAGVYFGIGFIIAAIIFRDQRTKKTPARALIMAILAGLFWIVLVLFIPFIDKKSPEEKTRAEAIKVLRAEVRELDKAESAPE